MLYPYQVLHESDEGSRGERKVWTCPLDHMLVHCQQDGDFQKITSPLRSRGIPWRKDEHKECSARLIKFASNPAPKLEIPHSAAACNMSSEIVSLQVTVTIAPENVTKFFEHFKPVYDAVIAEPECIFFEVYQSPENPGELRWVENWYECA
jgi:hypothetical protein